MYLMMKGKGGSTNYLTNAEKEMARKNEDGLAAFCEKRGLKNDFAAMAKYLNEDSHQKAVFSGALAKRLNLQYGDDGDQLFQKLIAGENPFTKEQWNQLMPDVKYRKNGRLINTSASAKGGEHMVLGMPKSFSIFYSLQTPERQKELRQAIIDADQEVMKKMATLTRPADSKYILESDYNNLDEEAKAEYTEDKIVLNDQTELVCADFHHYSARPDQFGQIDPHYHMHKQLMPVAMYRLKNGETKVMGIDNQILYENQKLLTSNFSTIAAAKLEEIGVALEDDRDHLNQHSFRVSGITRNTELTASSRKKDLEKIEATPLQEMAASVRQELTIAKSAYRSKSREGKLEINCDEEHLAIKQRSEGLLGFDGQKHLYDAQRNGKLKIEKDEFDLSKLVDFGNTGEVSKANIKAELGNILRFGGQRFKKIEDLDAAIDQFYDQLVKNDILIEKQNGMITHLSVVKTEIDAADTGKRLLNTRNNDKTQQAKNQAFLEEWNDALPSNRKLFEGQMEACKLVANDEKLILIEGKAGSAKTTSVAKFAKDLWSKEPDTRIIGLSTQTKTARSLKEVGYEETYNLAKFCSKYYDFEKGEYKPQAIEEARGQKIRILLDEGGMVGAEHHKILFGLAEKLPDFKIVEIGHTKQLASVSAGNVYTHLIQWISKEGIEGSTATLDKVVRHTNENTLGIAEAFHDQDPEKGIDIMKKQGWLHEGEYKQRDQLINELADAFMADPEKDKVAICYTNEDTQSLNDAIRLRTIQTQEKAAAEAKAQGIAYDKSNDIDYKKQITIDVYNKGTKKNSREYSERNFAKGDRIVLTDQFPEITWNEAARSFEQGREANGEKKIIASSSQGVIKGIMKDPNHPKHHILNVEIDGQIKQIFTAVDDHKCFTHAFAITTHQSQGITCESSYVLGSKDISSNMAYVQFSRSKSAVHCFIESKDIEGFVKNAAKAQVKASTLEDAKCQSVYERTRDKKISYTVSRKGVSIEVPEVKPVEIIKAPEVVKEPIPQRKAINNDDLEQKADQVIGDLLDKTEESKEKIWTMDEVRENLKNAKGKDERAKWSAMERKMLEEKMKARGIVINREGIDRGGFGF